MTQIVDVIRLTFEEEEFNYEMEEIPDEGGANFDTRVQGNHINLRIKGWVDNEKLLIHTFYPNTVPDNKKNAVVEILSRINSVIWFGNFQLDFSDGTILIRTNIPLIEGQASTKL